MRQQRKKVLSIFVMLFFLCLLLCETTYYHYESGSIVQSSGKGESKLRNPDTILALAGQFQAGQTLNSRDTLAHIERKMPERVRIGSMFLFLAVLASFVIETKKGEQEQSLCQFQTFFENLLNILHRQDGKKDDFFLCSC